MRTYRDAGYDEYIERIERTGDKPMELTNLDIEALFESIPAGLIVPEVQLA